MEKYEKLEKVGEGTYSKVYTAKDKATDQLVALKKKRLKMDEDGVPPTARVMKMKDKTTSPFFATLSKYIESSKKSQDFEILSGRLAMVERET